MRTLVVADSSRSGGERVDSGSEKSAISAMLAALCGVCGGRMAGGVVVSGQSSFCSLECAQAARDRPVPGNYLG